mgnify:CR=1 FL=1
MNQPFLIDTHCHLDLPVFDADRSEVIARARNSGVRAFVVIGFAPDRWRPALDLAESTPGVFATIGVHPNEASEYDDTIERTIANLARDPRVCAIGEIGLDYYWDRAPRSLQRDVFLRQIRLAQALDLPFVVHQRAAFEETINVLREAGPPHRGVMHCFTGDLAFARSCLDLGMHLGVGGVVTYPKADALREALRWVPLDRLVLETDSPYLAPVPYRGQRNEPANLALVAAKLADLRGVPLEEIARITSENAMRLLQLSAAHLNVLPDGRSAQLGESSGQ